MFKLLKPFRNIHEKIDSIQLDRVEIVDFIAQYTSCLYFDPFVSPLIGKQEDAATM